jgi:Zn-finger protein
MMVTGEVWPVTSSCDLYSNFDGKNTIWCKMCLKMKEEIKVILNKLKSAQLIIDMMHGNQKPTHRPGTDNNLVTATDGCRMESDPEGGNHWKISNCTIPHKSKPTKGRENEIPSLVPNQNSEHQEVSSNTEPSAEFVNEVPRGTIVEDVSLGHTVDSQEIPHWPLSYIQKMDALSSSETFAPI